MSTPDPEHGSIESFIAQQLPAWLLSDEGGFTRVDRLRAFRLALHRQELAVAALRPVLASIEPIETFAAAKLSAMLTARGLAAVDLQRSRVYKWLRPLLPRSQFAYSLRRNRPWSVQSLLEAALSNFPDSDTAPSSMYHGHLKDAQGNVMSMGLFEFASRCRALDIGGLYQKALRAILTPKGQTERIRLLFEEAQQAHLEVAVRMAFLKGELDESGYQHMLPLISSPPVVAPTRAVAAHRQLFLLGVAVHGVACVEVRATTSAPVDAVILWVPSDPHRPVQRYANWQALYDGLAQRLAFRPYRRFFERFIAESDRVRFFANLAGEMKGWKGAQGATLAGQNEPLPGTLKAYLARSRIDKIFSDARALAVPTADMAAQPSALQGLASLGLDMLGVVGLFVPVVGQLMTVVFAVELASEVYECYDEWDHGDRKGAMDHLFDVAENVVIGALTAKGILVGAKALKRTAFIQALSLILRRDGQLRLCDSSLKAYRARPGEQVGHLQTLFADEHSYYVSSDSDGSLRHPRRPDAHAPAVEYNGGGGWHHELERPWAWADAGKLVRRLSVRFAQLTDTTAEHLLQATGFSHEQIRRLHLEGSRAPARLMDSLERLLLHEQYEGLYGEQLQVMFFERQPLASEVENLLLARFPGLSMAGVREIFSQASSAELERMLTHNKVPMGMADRARWYVHESRVDRACEGLRRYRAVNDDSQALALGLIEKLAPWPDDVRFELREASDQGRLLATGGKPNSSAVIRMVRDGDRYRLSWPEGELDFMSMLFASLSEGQKAALAIAGQDVLAFEDRLALEAAKDRQQSAHLIGLTTRAALRPPRRFGDGQIGYALSGRAGGSRQMIAEEIRKVYSAMSDEELEAYVLDLVERRVGLWNHLHTLKENFSRLKEGLESWRREVSNVRSARRRKRVADAIRRSWRRKTVNIRDEYVLNIEGEHTGGLPRLPVGIRFEHVKRLVLHDMALTEIEPDFLRRFPNLIELDLSGNALYRIPEGLVYTTQLRRLDLSDNNIVMDYMGGQAMESLTHLRDFDISDNPELGTLPAVRHMVRLSHFDYHNTGVQQLPGAVPWRASMDARHNRIEDLTPENELMRQQLSRTALHGNPQPEAAEGGPRAVELADVQEHMRRRHRVVDSSVRGLWLGDAAAPQRESRGQLWDTLQFEHGSGGLFQFLADFTTSRDFVASPEHFRTRIWQLLEACSQHEAFRARLFEEANGPRGCDDRLLYTLRQFEVSVLAEQAMLGVPQEKAEVALVKLAQSLFRYDSVQDFAARHIERLNDLRRAGADLIIDEIETKLAFLVALNDMIDLPIPRDGMHYGGDANVTQNDFDLVHAKVLSLENEASLSKSLADRAYWERYAKAQYAPRFEALFDANLERLARIEEDPAYHPDDPESMIRMRALTAEYNTQERDLLATLAREAYLRAKPQLSGQLQS